MFKAFITLLILLAVTACSVPLTGDALQDCLNARNNTIQMENGVAIAEGVLQAAVLANASASTISRAEQGLIFAKSYLATAAARERTLCAPPPVIVTL